MYHKPYFAKSFFSEKIGYNVNSSTRELVDQKFIDTEYSSALLYGEISSTLNIIDRIFIDTEYSSTDCKIRKIRRPLWIYVLARSNGAYLLGFASTN
jgi:hypothetical protein